METIIQAHRGASAYCAENTLEAFSLACVQKAGSIELDVHLSKDGRIVVAHDGRLERVSDGKGHISDYTLDALKSFDFGKSVPGGPVCRIPTLEEVFDLIKPTPLTVNIELKTTDRLYPGLPEKLVSLAREYAMTERVLYSSFNHYSLLELKESGPAAKTGILYSMGMVDPWVYARYVHADAIHPHYSVIEALPETVGRCHSNGIMVNVWTVDSAEDINRMLRYGVDSIITNKPDLAVSCRDAYNGV